MTKSAFLWRSYEFEGKLYIQTGKVKPSSRQFATNPKVEVCAFTDGARVRGTCKLVEDDRSEAKKSILDAYPIPISEECTTKATVILKCFI